MLYRRSLEIELRLGTALRERGHTIRFGQREDGGGLCSSADQ